MKLKNILLTAGLGLGLIIGKANAQTSIDYPTSTSKLYEIVLSKEDVNTTMPIFHELQDALNYIPEDKDFSTTNDIIRINAYDGDYTTTRAFGEIYNLSNKELIGINNPIPKEKLDEKGNINPYEKGAMINGAFLIRDNCRVSNMILIKGNAYTSVILATGGEDSLLENVEVSNDYFDNSNENRGVIITPSSIAGEFGEVRNVKVINNIFQNIQNSYAGLTISNAVSTGTVICKDNLFYNNLVGVYTKESSRIKMNENVFTKNEKNFDIYYPPETLDWENNWWFDKDGNQLTTETAILGSGIVRSQEASPQKYSIKSDDETTTQSLDVVPFYTTYPYKYPNRTGIKSRVWEIYR